MPNWVNNTVSVRGDYNTVELFRSRISSPYEMQYSTFDIETQEHIKRTMINKEVFSFWNVIKPPKDKLSLYSEVSNGNADRDWNWYYWNNLNWGCKWDASNPEIVEVSENQIIYEFSTPWSPPLPVIAQITKDYPDLEVSIRYVEEQGWGGTLTLLNGKVINQEEWDIPDTHSESVKALGYCWCDGADEEDKPYSDCPKA
jgi:hypothetical protein